jgi:translation initiation factor IF-2
MVSATLSIPNYDYVQLLTSHCTGAIDTLKHVKKDVMEMGKGTECGIGFEGFEDLQVDDQIQTYEVLEEKRRL